jgi:glycosyltransferase involved in cell wall biosynthesis
VVADVVVVVPCYNEAGRFPGSAFAEFLRGSAGVGFILVDDGSSDATLEALRGLEREAAGRVQVLPLPENRGKAEAVRAGVLHAFEAAPAYVGYWDADLATPLPAILEFRDLLEARPRVQLVLGARVVLLGRSVERRPLRHYLGRVAATVTALALGLRVYDTQCGAKLFRATPQMRQLFEDPFVARWIFDIEILARLIQAQGGRGGAAGEALCEYPLQRWTDVPGSNLRPVDYLKGGVDLLRVYRRYLARGRAGDAPRR